MSEAARRSGDGEVLFQPKRRERSGSASDALWLARSVRRARWIRRAEHSATTNVASISVSRREITARLTRTSEIAHATKRVRRHDGPRTAVRDASITTGAWASWAPPTTQR